MSEQREWLQGATMLVAVGTDLVYVRPEYAGNARVLREEILHVLQQQGGLEIGAGGYGIAEAEIVVRQALIENARNWGLINAEVLELQHEIDLIIKNGGY